MFPYPPGTTGIATWTDQAGAAHTVELQLTEDGRLAPPNREVCIPAGSMVSVSFSFQTLCNNWGASVDVGRWIPVESLYAVWSHLRNSFDVAHNKIITAMISGEMAGVIEEADAIDPSGVKCADVELPNAVSALMGMHDLRMDHQRIYRVLGRRLNKINKG